MASIIYLDIDDEITSAAARIRAAEAVRIALVLPAGSHLATSRINFRLLAREAQGRSRQLMIVAPDASARALAASAGLPVYASVREMEAETNPASQTGESATDEPSMDASGAAAAPGEGPASARLAPGASGAADGAAGAALGLPGAPLGPPTAPAGAAVASGGAFSADDTVIVPPTRTGTRATSGEPARSAAGEIPVVGPSTRGRRTAIAVLLATLAVLVVVGGVLGYVFLPAATIVVTPRIEPIGPLTFPVRADPAVTEPDAVAGVVPAMIATLSLEQSGEFPATGTKVTETAARGEVTFSSFDAARSNSIPAGSIVSTQSDIEFRTGQTVILPPATLVDDGHGGIRIVPSTGDAPVSAVAKGTEGNVAAGAIRIVPADENPVVTKVTNKAPTSGGTHTETLIVAQRDIDKATASLTKQLTDDLASQLANPAGVLPDVTVFPETSVLTKPVPTVDPATLLGKAMTRFGYGLTATASVTTVDEDTVREVAESRLRAGVGTDHDLVRDSLRISVGKGSVLDKTIVFPVNASASRLRRLDAAELRSQARGRTIADARAALSAYGEVSIATWPGFVSSISTYDFRVDLTINSPAPVEGASPSPSDGEASDGAGTGADPSDAVGTDGAAPSGAGQSAGP
jgi:hypothetical protein